MFWDEKIEVLKKKFPQDQFRIPFSDWSDILKKIETKFLKRSREYRFTYWSEYLKEKAPIRIIPRQEIGREIAKLSSRQNYWVIIACDNAPTTEHLVYDCKIDAAKALLSIAPADFYLGDKKYAWLAYFKVDCAENRISLINAGVTPTPFDLPVNGVPA